MTQIQGRDDSFDPVPEIPPPPRLTRIEQGTWIVYALVALLLILIPVLTHSFGLPDAAAWVLLVGTVAMTAAWMRSGALRGPEWLRPDDYEKFLSEVQRGPGDASGESAPPRPTAPLSGPEQSGGQPPRP